MKRHQIILAVLGGMVFLAGLVWIAQPDPDRATLNAEPTQPSTLVAKNEDGFDFGTISMAAGKVKKSFSLVNTGKTEVVINKVYTSCMCTSAILTINDKQFGPFGMPGHGFLPSINQTVAPGAEVSVEAIFDPAAHGPAGVGQISRTVIIENSAGAPVELKFAGLVTP